MIFLNVLIVLNVLEVLEVLEVLNVLIVLIVLVVLTGPDRLLTGSWQDFNFPNRPGRPLSRLLIEF